MVYNQSSKQIEVLDKKCTFRNYIYIQVRYIRYIAFVLNIDSLKVIEKFAITYKNKYYKKHNYIT